MRRLAYLAAGIALAGAVVFCTATAPSLAQGMTASPAAVEKMSAEQRREARAAKKAKRTVCKRQANEQKLRLLKRYRFMRDCMARA